MRKVMYILATSCIVLLILLWVGGIIPKQIAKSYSVDFMNTNYSEMKLEFIDVEWDDDYESYAVKFKDKESKTYRCLISPEYFPISLGQGIYEINNAYIENFKDKN